MPKKNSQILISVSLFFIIAVIVAIKFVFINTISNSLTITLEIALIICSAFFGKSIEEMQVTPELKKLASSAKRRTLDTLSSLSRMQERISGYLHETRDNVTIAHFESLIDINQALQDNLRSSESDWLDILGEESEKKEKILEHLNKINVINSSDRVKLEEIKDLIKEIPTSLINYAQIEPRNPEISQLAFIHFLHSINRNNGILIINSNLYNNEACEYLQIKGPLFFHYEQSMHQLYLSIIGKEFEIISEIENPYNNIISKNDYIFTLYQLLSNINKKLLIDAGSGEKPKENNGITDYLINNDIITIRINTNNIF